jgi:hypothetical protein
VFVSMLKSVSPSSSISCGSLLAVKAPANMQASLTAQRTSALGPRLPQRRAGVIKSRFTVFAQANVTGEAQASRTP